MANTTDQTKRRNLNRYNILKDIYHNGPMRRTILAERLGIRKSSITSIAEELLKNHWLTNIDPSHPRSALCFKTSKHCILALSHETTLLKGALFGLDGKRINVKEVPISSEATFDEFLQITKSLSQDLFKKSKLKPLMVSMALPGIINSSKGLVIDCANATCLTNVKLSQVLTEIFNVPSIIENDVRASMMGIIWQDKQWRQLQNALYLVITEGVSSALLINGKLHKGANHSAGEIGHIKAGYENRLCHCNKTDCLETYISTKVLAKALDLPHPIQINDLINELSKKTNLEILTSALAPLANIIRPLIAAVDPEIIFLGNQDKRFYELCIPILQDTLKTSTKLHIVNNSNSAALSGIASKAINYLFTHGIGLGG